MTIFMKVYNKYFIRVNKILWIAHYSILKINTLICRVYEWILTILNKLVKPSRFHEHKDLIKNKNVIITN